MDPNPVRLVSSDTGEVWTQSQTHMEGGHHVKTGVMQPQAKELGERPGTNPSLEPSKEVALCHLDFKLLASRIAKE